MPNLRLFWESWILANGQWRLGFAGIFALDYPAVEAVFEANGLEMTPRFLRYLRALEAVSLENIQKNSQQGGEE